MLGRIIGIIIVLYSLYLIIGFGTVKTIQSVHVHDKSDGRFPKVIYRTMEDLTVNSFMYELCHARWKSLNPGYNIYWYTGKNQEEFIQTHYPGDVLNAYKRLKPGAFKADLWRLCILHTYGGVYSDAYVTPYVPIDTLLKHDKGKLFISALDCPSSGSGIHNGIIISEKGHPFLKQAIADIVENVKAEYYGNSSLDVTGPTLLSRSINKVLGKPTSNIHKKGWNRHGNLSFYLLEHCWGPYQNIYDKNVKVFSKNYSILAFMYRKRKKTEYAHMWKRRDIYSKA